MLDELEPTERLRLMKFVCSFAWADLEVHPREREFISGLVDRLGLDETERLQVRAWLEVPPRPEAIDPTLIPIEHRQLFLRSIEGVIAADGEIAPEEQENLELLHQLLA